MSGKARWENAYGTKAIVDYAGPEALAANGQRQVETLRDVIRRAGIKMP